MSDEDGRIYYLGDADNTYMGRPVRKSGLGIIGVILTIKKNNGSDLVAVWLSGLTPVMEVGLIVKQIKSLNEESLEDISLHRLINKRLSMVDALIVCPPCSCGNKELSRQIAELLRSSPHIEDV